MKIVRRCVMQIVLALSVTKLRRTKFKTIESKDQKSNKCSSLTADDNRGHCFLLIVIKQLRKIFHEASPFQTAVLLFQLT